MSLFLFNLVNFSSIIPLKTWSKPLAWDSLLSFFYAYYLKAWALYGAPKSLISPLNNLLYSLIEWHSSTVSSGPDSQTSTASFLFIRLSFYFPNWVIKFSVILFTSGLVFLNISISLLNWIFWFELMLPFYSEIYFHFLGLNSVVCFHPH